MSFAGTWHVVSSPELHDEYLRTEVEPHIKLRQAGDHVHGEYHLGLQKGHLDGRLQGEHQILFSFRETDAMRQVSGTGTATLEGDRLVLTLMHPKGDDITLVCERG